MGSTTVKAVVRRSGSEELLDRCYVRHGCRQAETAAHELRRIEERFGLSPRNAQIYFTGSGGAPIAEIMGARFVQEVTAVSLAVEKLHPEAGSVIELGGQDAKIVVFSRSRGSARRKFASMNDKCAGGTGAVIDKIAAKLGLAPDALAQLRYDGRQLYPVAGKCGVFAETDITGLQKQGVSPEDLMASLFEAIVLQNLSVLTRGQKLLPHTLLLGGPNAFLPGLRQAWSHHLLRLWREEGIDGDEECLRQKILSPENATLYGAIGAIEYGRETEQASAYAGCRVLEDFLANGRETHSTSTSCSLTRGLDEFHRFLNEQASVPAKRPLATFEQVYLGIDGGSTSMKAVCMSPRGEVLASAYRLSAADPVANAIEVFQDLQRQFAAQGSEPRVLGSAATGYSRDLLRKVFHLDHAVVETVAHAKSAMAVAPQADVIVDVGGQDIKIMRLRHGVVKDFRLNTQCSAGNGYFLQSAAESLGIGVEQFAETAFTAKRAPVFSYGCAVFLQSDIVNFQRQGWQPQEIVAGLAEVLPKNVFLYVAGVANLARLGHSFLLQGGTQRNLAVVKAETDFIRTHYFAADEPEIHTHPYCGEAGAIGAALHAQEHDSGCSNFTGFESLAKIHYTIQHDASTRCGYCSNHCLRTFVRTRTGGSSGPSELLVLANCERGELTDPAAVRAHNRALRETEQRAVNIPKLAGRLAFEPQFTEDSAGGEKLSRRRVGGARTARAELRIGIPRVLNLYAYAPFFTAYLQSLGVAAGNIVFSGTTTPEMLRNAMGLASIDPCFPSKICVAHVRELLRLSDAHKLDAIFFPCFDHLATPLDGCVGNSACPAGSATPEAVKAVFALSRDDFARRGIVYLDPLVDFSTPELLRRQMFDAWHELLHLGWDENEQAVQAGWRALRNFNAELQRRSREALDRLHAEGRVGLVLLGRPYHHDPGVNHGIPEEFQKLGYPVFSQSFLPLDADLLEQLFGEDVRSGRIASPLSIADVWKTSNSAGANLKVWAAKFAAAHPNLIPVELTSFKCGHDAFISRVVQEIAERAGKPHFCFGDLDENKPAGALRIRIETMQHFLQGYEAALQKEPRRGRILDFVRPSRRKTEKSGSYGGND